jgi:hypothetical protein
MAPAAARHEFIANRSQRETLDRGAERALV